MLAEEADELGACVGPLRVGVGAVRDTNAIRRPVVVGREMVFGDLATAVTLSGRPQPALDQSSLRGVTEGRYRMENARVPPTQATPITIQVT